MQRGRHTPQWENIETNNGSTRNPLHHKEGQDKKKISTVEI